MTLFLVGCDELKLKPGQQFSRKITMTSKFNMSIFNNVDDKDMQMTLLCKVLSVDNSGNATVQAQISKIESKINTMGIVFQYSSEKPEINTQTSSRPEIQKVYVDIMSSLAGKKYSAVIDKSGKVLELKDIDAEIAKYSQLRTDDKITGRNQAIMLLAPARLKEYVSPGLYNGMPADTEIGAKLSGYEVVVPSLPALPNNRTIVEPGSMAQATSDWREDVKKFYYAVSCDGLPGKLEADQEPPATVDEKYRSVSHSAISVFGNGCIGYAPGKGFYKQVERVFVEVRSNRLNETQNTGSKKRKVRMYYIVDTTIENVD
ncbi:MAG: hypothetical protein JW745_03470 [Sedimentisphaerales bacterium]|nr:hypothetical protein [Sedimentisphaerales bacterium]MBN2843643.1 hypothetical protein [Sedimentisphaerales bacterium]